MQISAKELRQMASDVDDMHHEAMRDFKEETSELHLQAVRGSRRSFMRKAGLAGAGGALLTMGGGLTPFTRLVGIAGAQDGALTDTVIAGYAQSVELAAVAAYTAAAPALKGDVLAVAQLFLSHHQDHADAFAAVAGKDARPEPNPKLVAAVTPTLDAVTEAVKAGQDVTTDVLSFAKVVENQAAYTYAAALTLLTDPAYAAATSTILPIEAQHATVLSLALGEGPDKWFPTGAFESASLGDGTDPLAGFDPAIFA
ncbi:MAG TPA: ferritin-like domain-containing protein [Acidimicrobiales bacterium]|nr:ferritin-like domain-containing protein [Acidimicrobiales bacterium]